MKKNPGWLGYIGDEILHRYMGVSENRGTAKFMVYNGKPYHGGTTIFGNTHIGDYTTQVYRDYFINRYKDPS